MAQAKPVAGARKVFDRLYQEAIEQRDAQIEQLNKTLDQSHPLYQTYHTMICNDYDRLRDHINRVYVFAKVKEVLQ